MNRLCLIEDDEIMGESLADRFLLDGYACDWHRTARDAKAAILTRDYFLVISDIRLPDMAGDELFATLQADPLLSKIPAIAAGRVAVLPNATPLAASANPSPLSIGWGISDYFAILADAAAK